MQELKDSHLHSKITAFDVFAFLGVLVNVAVLAPAIWLPHITRRKIWFNLIISWIIYSASYLFLLARQMGSEPPLGLCIFQAALTTSMTLVCIVASTCFAIDFALQITTAIQSGREVNRTLTNFVAFFPWLTFLVVFMLVQLIATKPSMVIRDPSHLFCTIDSRPLRLTIGIMVLVSATILFPLEAYIAVLFYRYSVVLPRKNFIHSSTISFSTFIRLVLFTVISATGIGVHSYIIARVDNTVTTCSVILTSLPVMTGLMFGTTRDILQAWMFWKKTTPPNVHQYSNYPFAIDPRMEEAHLVSRY